MRSQPVPQPRRRHQDALRLGVQARRRRLARLRRLEDRRDSRAADASRSPDEDAGGRAEHHEDPGDEQENDHNPDCDLQHFRFLAYALKPPK
jgi:hypothetical protein